MALTLLNMKKQLIAALAGILFSLNLSAQKPAEIYFETASHDFGDISKTEAPVQTCSFRFWNSGDSSLVIRRISTGCPCTTAKFPSEAVAPGDTNQIVVTYNGSHQSLGRFQVDVFLETNSKSKYSVLIIKGNLVNSVAKKPE